jgi:Xaa-Pro aminopeptidase
MSFQDRIAYVRGEMEARNIDLLFLTPSTAMRYLTGYNGRMMERLSCCVIGKDFQRFVGPAFELSSLDPKIRELLDCSGWADGTNPFQLLQSLIGRGQKKAAIARYSPIWVFFGLQKILPCIEWREADEILDAMRIRKDQDEYKMLKRVQDLSCRALQSVLEHGVRGMSEIEVGRLLIDYTEELGLATYMPIVASGPNTANPHHRPSGRVIQEGDTVLFDFGGNDPANGYQADTTRTFVVGKPPDGFEEIYAIVLKANQAAFKAARPGVTCESVDAAARSVIDAAGYGEYFTHRLGHGLGLDIHESPYLIAGNTELVQTGYCFSDEPGIYLSGRFGIRIEDALFIHEDGAERITPLDHAIHVIQ